MIDIKSRIREVPDWPKPGVNFKDITTLLEDPSAFREVIDLMTNQFSMQTVDKVVGIDSRGFLLAGPVAYKLSAGLSIVRKKGKLPYRTVGREYTLEYASDSIEMHQDTIKPGEKVLLVDDICATGGTALATCDLIEKLGGVIIGVTFLIDLPFLGGSAKLKERNYDVRALVEYYKE